MTPEPETTTPDRAPATTTPDNRAGRCRDRTDPDREAYIERIVARAGTPDPATLAEIAALLGYRN